MIKVDIQGIESIKDIAALLPRDLERAHGVAARSATAAGYNVAAEALADATGTEPTRWKKYRRVFTDVDSSTKEAKAWMGLNPYPERSETVQRELLAGGASAQTARKQGVELIPFPDDFDPSPQVGEVMSGAYLRVLDSQVQKIIEGR